MEEKTEETVQNETEEEKTEESQKVKKSRVPKAVWIILSVLLLLVLLTAVAFIKGLFPKMFRNDSDVVTVIGCEIDDLIRSDSFWEYENTDNYKTVQGDLPEYFDLREQGYVTPVKLQYPWGTCWSFGTTAAVETSILSGLGLTTEEYEEKYGSPLDLSEMHTAYFAHRAIPEKESESDASAANNQEGEGNYAVIEQPNQEMTGGSSSSATSIYASGIGPVMEKDAPYRGREGKMSYQTTSRGSQVYCYDPEDDWSLDETDRFAHSFDIMDANNLPCPNTSDASGNYVYSPEGTDAIKRELFAGRGVAIAFCADNSMPGKPSEFNYMVVNGDKPSWAHYTYDHVNSNHLVCIVGWDDNYSVENFLPEHQPPANGAWIVKNSWGCVDAEDEANRCDWGYEGSGYFYLSYYDESLAMPTSYRFREVDDSEGITYTLIDEYDLMPCELTSAALLEKEVSLASVFTVEYDEELVAVSVKTSNFNSTVTADVYLLSGDSEVPADGKLVATVTETFPYAGYHRIDLSTPVDFSKGDRYAIVEQTVTKTSEGLRYELPYNLGFNEEATVLLEGGEEAVKTSDFPILYQKGVVNPGESYLCYNGQWYDWSEILEELETGWVYRTFYTTGMYTYDNFSVKGYAVPK